MSCQRCLDTWVVFANGPDLSENEVVSEAPHYKTYDPEHSVTSYNPTNGTWSDGDIFLYGGDPFWIGVALETADKTIYESSGTVLDQGLDVDGEVYLHRLPLGVK